MLELTPLNFKVVPTMKGIVLGNDIKGISLIVFYKLNCEKSNTFLQLFDTAMDDNDYCTFAKVNTDMYPEYIAESAKTKTPINVSDGPYVVIYVDGRPYMSYDGPVDNIEIKKLLMYVHLMQTVTASLNFNNDTIIPVYKIES